MARRQPYSIIFAPAVKQHLRKIDAKFHGLVRRTIEERLEYEPTVKTRNRKPLMPPAPFGAEWEIRFGPNNCFRALYEVDSEQRVVQVLAVGQKEGNRLIVGGEEVEL